MTNQLYYGDNLGVLREHIADASVDLVYLDPPFNSNATYNVLFKAPDGVQSQAQIEAFDDTWHWTESAKGKAGRASGVGFVRRGPQDAENSHWGGLSCFALQASQDWVPNSAPF